MDRSWMSKSRLSNEYEEGIEQFITFALENGADADKMICPCKDCYYSRRIKVDDIRDHLVIYGIIPDYTRWIWHGEKTARHDSSCDTPFDTYGIEEDDRLDDMIHGVEDNFAEDPDRLQDLLNDARLPLYDGCIRFTKMSALLKLYHLKARHGWSDASFTAILELLKEMLPEGNCLPISTYEAKKIICSMGMKYERIHACPNDCVLYRNEYACLDKCPNPDCLQPRYKKKDVPPKVLCHKKKDAKKLTWHANGRVKDGKIRHPADSKQWETIDNKYPHCKSEERNLRLALSTDGMNPFGNLSTIHSTWPVVLVIYNLPPWLCMKRKYMMLSLLISGPKQPGFEIDVYLAPLIEDLKDMWEDGIDVFDAHRKENFRMRAILFCTINDYPAYGNLSGHQTKGYIACPIYGKNTYACRLEKSHKIAYLRHRRFIDKDHHYRRLRKAFDGSTEEGSAPIPLTGEEVLAMVDGIDVRFGKNTENKDQRDGWKKKSIFFYLPYWKDLSVRHCLDVMHIEKNICDSLIGTLLNVPGKTKDGIKAREDYKVMGVRPELQPQKRGSRTYLPPACYTLSKKEISIFCKFLRGIKVPDGYSSNISNLVSMKDLRLVGLKTHDCHVLMQQLVPVAIRSILPKHVRFTIIRLCFFFKKLCSKVIDRDELGYLQSEISDVLCRMEMYFPFSFFDIMVHLAIHLVREFEICGPVYLRWMYPFERYMKILKGYVMNRQYPEGYIVERYIVEEAVEFCGDYLSNVESIGLPKCPQMGELDWKGTLGYQMVTIKREMQWKIAHLYVLHNIEEVQPYVDEHMANVRSKNPNKSEKWITTEHNDTFIQWFQDRVSMQLKSGEEVSANLRSLHRGPRFQAMSYSGFVINNCTFYTKNQDDKSATQNSGVTLEAHAMHVAGAKDKNPVYASMSYYGVIEHIWVLIYSKELKILVFCCKWVDINSGVRVDEMGFISVALEKAVPTNDPFILASQATQVFYVPDLVDSRWSTVMFTPKRNNVEEVEDLYVESSGSKQMLSSEESGTEEEIYVRDDHGEGIWLNEEILGENDASTTTHQTKKRK